MPRLLASRAIRRGLVAAVSGAVILAAILEAPGATWMAAGWVLALTALWTYAGRSRSNPISTMAEDRSLLETVLNTVPHALYVKDLDQRLVLVNKATEVMSAAPAQELLGKDIAALSGVEALPTDQLNQVLETDAEVLTTGKTQEFVIDRVFPDGHRKMRITKSPVRDWTGAITGMLVMAEDITARLAAEQETKQQRAMLRTVFDAIPHFVYVKDRQDRFVMVNRAMEAKLPKGSGSLIGKQVMFPSLRTPDEIQHVIADNRRVLDQGVSLDFHREIKFGPDHRWHFRTIKVPLRTETGEVFGLVGIDQDETGRMHAEREASTQRELLQAVLDAIPQDLFVKDVSGTIIMVNQTLANRWEMPKSQLLGTRGHGNQGLTAEDLQRIDDSDRRVLQQGTPHSWTQQLTEASGATKTFRVHKVPLRNHAGAISGLVMTGEDITELSKSQEALAKSQWLLQAVLDAIPENVSLKDRQFRYLLVNRAAPDRLGIASEELIGRTVADLPFMSEQGKVDSQQADQYVLATGKPTVVPLVQWRTRDGSLRWERVLKEPIRDESGAVSGIVTIGEDVTELVIARQDAERARRLLQTIMDTLPVGVFVKDLQGRFTVVNAPFGEIYNLGPKDVVGRTTRELPYITADRKELMMQEDQRVFDGREGVDSGIFEGPAVPGRPERWYRVIKTGLRGENGTMHGIVGLAMNITDQKKAEEERLALSRLMQRTQNLESMGVMAGGIAHEFNNLLQRIMGHTELILADVPKDHRLRGDAEMIQQAGRTAVGLTNQMVALSGRSRFNVEPVHLGSVVAHLLPELRSLMPAGIGLAPPADGAGNLVLADEPLLQQVVVSLVINATEALANRQGTIALDMGTAQVGAEMVDDHGYSDRTLRPGVYAYVEVADNGPGIAPAILERLYEPFFSTKFIGRGLGLAAVRGIVHGHHGSLHVRSTEGQGTVFRVLLPIAPQGQDRN